MKRLTLVLGSLALALVLAACTPGVEPNTVTYALTPENNSGVEGFVTFDKQSETATTITIDLEGTTAGATHPAHIHVGDVGTGGDIWVSLNPVDGDTGTSVTVVSQTDAGDPVTYEELTDFDGYVNVHQSPDNLATIIASGETGAGAAPVVSPIP